MSFLNQDHTNPREQEKLFGEGPYEKTLGPYRESTLDPASYRNKFVSDLKKNPRYDSFYTDSTFPSDSASQAQINIDEASRNPFSEFPNKFDKRLADDFLVKYTEGVKRELINDPVFPTNLDILRSEQPPTAANEKNAATVGKFPNQGVSIG